MLQSHEHKIFNAWVWIKKIIVWDEKIVFRKEWKKYLIITYIKKTEYDKIEQKILWLVKYYKKRNK